jgi:uroporphyrinogen decarboxylase
MGFDITLNELKVMTENKVTLLGNIPPRDVLAAGSPHEVSQAAIGLLNSLKEKSNIILSCGGGMPPGVKTENIQAFINAIKNNRE